MPLPAPYQWTFRPQTYRPNIQLTQRQSWPSAPSIGGSYSLPSVQLRQSTFSPRGPSGGSSQLPFAGEQMIFPQDANTLANIRQNAATAAVTAGVGQVPQIRTEQNELPASFGLLYNKPNLPGAWSWLNTPLGVLGNAGAILEGPKNVLFGAASGLGSSLGRLVSRAQGVDPDSTLSQYDDPRLGNMGKIYKASSVDNPLEAMWKGASEAVNLSRKSEFNNFFGDEINSVAALFGQDARPTNQYTGVWWGKNGGGLAGFGEDAVRATRGALDLAGNMFTDPAMAVHFGAGSESTGAAKGLAGIIKDMQVARAQEASRAGVAAADTMADLMSGTVRGAVKETVDGFAPQAANMAEGAAQVAERNAANAASVAARHGAAVQFNNAIAENMRLGANAANQTIGNYAPRTVSELVQDALELSKKPLMDMTDDEVRLLNSAQNLLKSSDAAWQAQTAKAAADAAAGRVTWREALQEYYKGIGASGVKKLADESEEQFAARLSNAGQKAMEDAAARSPRLAEKLKPFLDEAAVGDSMLGARDAAQAADEFVTFTARDASRLRLQVPFSHESYDLPGGRWLLEKLPSLRESQRLSRALSGISKFRADQVTTGSRLGSYITRDLGYMSEGAKQVGAVKGVLTEEQFYKTLEQEAAKIAESRSGMRRLIPKSWVAREETRRLGGIVSLLEQRATYHGIEFGDIDVDDWIAKNIKSVEHVIDGEKRFYNFGPKGIDIANPADGLGYATKEEADKALREHLAPLTATAKLGADAQVDTAVAASPRTVIKKAEQKAASEAAAEAVEAPVKPAKASRGARGVSTANVAENAPESVAEVSESPATRVLERSVKKNGKAIAPKGAEVKAVVEKKKGETVVRIVTTGQKGERVKLAEAATEEEAWAKATGKKGVHISDAKVPVAPAEPAKAMATAAPAAAVEEAAPVATKTLPKTKTLTSYDFDITKNGSPITEQTFKNTRSAHSITVRVGDGKPETYYIKKFANGDGSFEWASYAGRPSAGGEELVRSTEYSDAIKGVNEHMAGKMGATFEPVTSVKGGHARVLKGFKMVPEAAVDGVDGSGRYSVDTLTESGRPTVRDWNNDKPVMEFDTVEQAEETARKLNVISSMQENNQIHHLTSVTSNYDAKGKFFVARPAVNGDLELADDVLPEATSMRGAGGATVADRNKEAARLLSVDHTPSTKEIVGSEGLTSPEVQNRIKQVTKEVEREFKTAERKLNAAVKAFDKGKISKAEFDAVQARFDAIENERQWLERYSAGSSAAWRGDADIVSQAQQASQDELDRIPAEMAQRDMMKQRGTKEMSNSGELMLFNSDHRFVAYKDPQMKAVDGTIGKWYVGAVDSIDNEQTLMLKMVEAQRKRASLEAAGELGEGYSRVKYDIATLEQKIEEVQGGGYIVNFHPGKRAQLTQAEINNMLDGGDTQDVVQQLVDRNGWKLNAKKNASRVPKNLIEHDDPLFDSVNLVAPSQRFEDYSAEQSRLLKQVELINTGAYTDMEGAQPLAAGMTLEQRMAEGMPEQAGASAASLERAATPYVPTELEKGWDERTKTLIAQYRQEAKDNLPEAIRAEGEYYPRAGAEAAAGDKAAWRSEHLARAARESSTGGKPEMRYVPEEMQGFQPAADQFGVSPRAQFRNAAGSRGGGVPSGYGTRTEKLKELIHSGSLSTKADWKGDLFIPNIDPKTGDVIVTYKNAVTGEMEHFGTFQSPEAAAYYLNAHTGSAVVGGKQTMFFNTEVIDRKLDDILTKLGKEGLNWNYTEPQIAIMRESVRKMAELEYEVMDSLNLWERARGFGENSSQIGAYVSGEVPRKPIPTKLSNANPFAKTLNEKESSALYKAMGLDDAQIAGLNANSKRLYGETTKEASKEGNELSKYFLNRLGVTPNIQTGEQGFEKARSMTNLGQRAKQVGLGMELNQARRVGHRVEMGMVATQQDAIRKVAGSILGRQIPYVGQNGNGEALFTYPGKNVPVTMKELDELASGDNLNNLIKSHDGRSVYAVDAATKAMIEDVLNPGTMFDDNNIMQGIKSTSSRWLMPLMTIFSPSFTMNNTVGNIEHALLNGHLTPESMWQAGQDVADMMRMTRKGGKLAYDADDMLRIVFDEGEDATDSVMKMMKSGVMTPASFSQQIAELNGAEAKAGLSEIPGLHKYANFFRRVNNMSENYFRSAVYHSALNRGMSEGAAVAEVNRIMLDYYQSSLTRVERTLRYFVPFYTFSRRNIPYSLEFAAKNPAMANFVYNRAPMLMSDIGTDEQGHTITPNLEQYGNRLRLLSPGQRQFMGQMPLVHGGLVNGQVPTDEAGSSMETFQAINPKLTMGDTVAWMEPARELMQALTGEHRQYNGAPDFEPFVQEAKQQSLQSLNPVFKMIYELGGKEIDTGADIEGNSTGAKMLNAIIGNFPMAGQFYNALKSTNQANTSAPYDTGGVDEDGNPIYSSAKGNPDALANFIAARISSQYPRDINLQSNNRQWEYFARNEGDRLKTQYESDTGNELPDSGSDLTNYIKLAPSFSGNRQNPDFQQNWLQVNGEMSQWQDMAEANKQAMGYNPAGNSSPPIELLDRWIRMLYGTGVNDQRALMQMLPLLPVRQEGLGGGLVQTSKELVKRNNLGLGQDPNKLAQYMAFIEAARGRERNRINNMTYGMQQFGSR